MIKRALLFNLALLPIALVAGYFVIAYQIDIYSEDILAEAVAQLGSVDVLIAVGIAQTVMYTAFCGFFGYILAGKLGLWKPFEFDKSKLLVTFIVSLAGGVVFSLDHWTFGGIIDGIKEANAASLTANGIIASILYGGVIEEVMMRLFFMSLVAFIIWKLFFRNSDSDDIPTAVFVIANVIAVLLFAAGHLPATLSLFGELTPLILVRCFLLNGGFGLIFGELYRRYGIVYAMMSHALFHIVSKVIWIIFI